MLINYFIDFIILVRLIIILLYIMFLHVYTKAYYYYIL